MPKRSLGMRFGLLEQLLATKMLTNTIPVEFKWGHQIGSHCPQTLGPRASPHRRKRSVWAVCTGDSSGPTME
jgi:hypothetical protein